jgi:microcystin-dependent protein
LGLGHQFRIFSDKIETPGDGLIIFRGMQAATAKYRDDIAGAIVTGGTSTAYTVSSYEMFDTLAHLNGQMIAFTPHTTNGATVTLNVDSVGAKPLRSAPGMELLAGTIIQGTPYVATYNNSDGAFYLQGFYGNPYSVPLGGMLPFIGSAAPNSSFVFPFGQAISRTTYATLFTLVSTAYGAGDGSTTFGLPDFRGRVLAGKDDMGGSTAGRLTGSGIVGTTLGATGGAPTQTLLTANLPPYTPAGSLSVTSTVSGIPTNAVSFSGQRTDGAGTGIVGPGGAITPVTVGAVTSTGSLAGTAQGGTSMPVVTVQPTIVCNYILRII